jgi:hypothetical protein
MQPKPRRARFWSVPVGQPARRALPGVIADVAEPFGKVGEIITPSYELDKQPDEDPRQEEEEQRVI